MEVNLPNHIILKLLKEIKQLYSIPESDIHFYLIYLYHHLKSLAITTRRSDLCIFVRRIKEG